MRPKFARLGRSTSQVKDLASIVRKPAIKACYSEIYFNEDSANGLWRFALFSREWFLLCNWVSAALPTRRRCRDNTHPHSYAGEKRRQLHTHGCGADDVGTPSWCLTIIRSLREKPSDALYSHARNIPYLANLNNELIDQTALEALDGVSCSAGCHVWQAASFPTDSLSSLTVNYPVLFIVCANLPFVSPIRLSEPV